MAGQTISSADTVAQLPIFLLPLEILFGKVFISSQRQK